ncbi:MAG: bifunctional (p)ppGpp synthetase/guanosine-3',5'-bis(diphosphate) 3'-pyrophosphohydrolase [Nitrosomonas sp.]|jgi:GTP pyrophosphokinase|nr:bifunctional (p)ppGpp synthetase/guanosine-3',5'-bis(diphosphate) 3'-pyrophosphohydrolase [Nitrosomonas sp.]MCP5252086.1 bifunctional (p)ppGpp synthetase/guanosine-3',5'-bis(diphosphate) 3'-pyrophosphohydrolase [Burkholderiales bacterium]MDR4519029.1 bifunctional (p)ppGpp synthetase/guanosine-3',5'-bis(diphosphate) 3'-pyrophosphohydrolase [Nitrosomonas sp.]MDR4653353.1 bifunctional (p)ppGpp synthetase/guanosine-3',5'-bis(diphosphate) 3'-pyrophosphohydrolase [Nitrosomonas sp.]HQU61773.1 bifun
MSEAELLFSEVAQYLRPEDVAQLKVAYSFGQGAHSGQFRKSGEPYISHPLAVARILSGLHLDAPTLTAALLHDVVEDTHISKEEISERFGDPVAELVDGVSKLDKIQFQTQEDAQAENFRKMLLAMARDVRVILIKLADRLHNMQTLEAMPAEKQRRISRETLEIYAPIALRLGLNNIYQELQELGFRYSYPLRYRVLIKATKAARGNRREVVGKIQDAITHKLKEAGLDFQVSGREKHIYSIYKKMVEKQLSFSEVLDIYGFRVIVNNIPSCYVALGALHGLYKPIPGKFKDYIAIPKENGYQSLHSTLLGPFNIPIEIQIRTQEMHRIAEDGVASHWIYKSSDANLNDLHLKTSQWLQSLLEMLSDTSDSLEFLEHLKVDLFPGDVYVFTPQGRIMTLPRGSTAVDFAYAIHSDIGNCCVAVKINGENAPLRSELKNGDRVEIITAPYAKPNPSWLSYVTTGRARSHIRHFLRTIQYEESVELGERMLNQALAALNIESSLISETQWEKLVRDIGAKSRKALLADMALGKQLPAVIAKRLASPRESEESKHVSSEPITILGTEGLTVQFAKCCHPIPGDIILGLIKKEQGLVIHMNNCPIIAQNKKNAENYLDVAWGKDITRTFEVKLRIVAVNRHGVLARIAAAIAKTESNIDDVDMESEKDYTAMSFVLQVRNRYHLAQVIRNLRRIKEVARITRI